MKKKRLIVFLVFLLCLVTISIGYAMTTKELNINGTVSIRETDSNFNIYFDHLEFNGGNTNTTDNSVDTYVDMPSGEIDSSDKLKATINFNLKEADTFQMVDLYVKNDSSRGIGAKIKSDDIKIYAHGTNNLLTARELQTSVFVSNEIIGSGSVEKITVMVKLVRGYVGEKDYELYLSGNQEKIDSKS